MMGKLPIDIIRRNYSNPNSEIKQIILVIPGNPGLVDYYSRFATTLAKELKDDSTAVWAVSHACHSSQEMNTKEIASGSPLDIEIEHKLRFIETEIPTNCKIHLVGHSIGCYMILSVLQILSGLKPRILGGKKLESESQKSHRELLSRINKCYFLFPTIERMRVSPNGQRLWPFIKYLRPVACFLLMIVNWLPSFLLSKIARLSLGYQPIDELMVQTTKTLLTPRIFSSMLKLAYNELNHVVDLEVNAIQTLKNKLLFYFGKKDGWCPLFYAEELQARIPDLECHIDDKDVEHAFVLKSSDVMAKKVAEFVRV